MGVAKHLILPVETAARELDAKLLLALEASGRGIAVTIGAKALVNLDIHKLAPGVYLPPNFHPSSDKIIRIARRLGHRIVAWDEEGLVWLNPTMYRARRTSRTALEGLDLVMLWGEEQAEAMAPALEGLTAPNLLTGNPRADLLRPELRGLYAAKARQLRDELGDFVLINSNFGWINHLLAHGAIAGGGTDLTAVAAKSKFPLAYLQHRERIYRALVAALPEIASRLPGRRIIVRPHPDESPVGWKAASAGLSNVEVRYDTDLVPWLLAAGHMIHNGCTTAVEMAMLDRVAISFRPFVEAEHEIGQPTAVSLDAHSVEDLLALLADPGVTDRPPDHARAALAHMVASVSGPTSSARVVDAIDTILSGPKRPHWSLGRLAGQAFAVRRRFRKLSTSRDAASTSNPDYYGYKFPPTTLGVIEEKLNGFAERLGRPAPVVAELSDRVFRVTAA